MSEVRTLEQIRSESVFAERFLGVAATGAGGRKK
jgi:hypothetical protein